MHRLLFLSALALALAPAAAAQSLSQSPDPVPGPPPAAASAAKADPAPVSAPRVATDEPKAAPAPRGPVVPEVKGAVAGLGLAVSPARRGGVSASFAGTLAGRPDNLDRPDCNPDNPTDPDAQCQISREDVRWEVHPFTVTASGTYTLTADWSGFDGYLLLYADDFLPGSPFINIIGTNDDFGSTARSQIVIDLQPGRYELVAAEFSNGEPEGPYAGTIEGPGGVIAVVTEAPTAGIYSGTTDEGVGDRPAGCDVPNPTDPQTQCNLRQGDHAYSSRSLLVFQDALVHVRSAQTDDAVIAVYSGGFDPENPLDNLVAYDDDDFDTRSSEVAFEAFATEVDVNNSDPIGYYVVVTYRYSASGTASFDNEYRAATRSDGGNDFVTGYPFADLAAGEITANTPTMPRVNCTPTYPDNPQTDCSTGPARAFRAVSFTPTERGFVNLISTQQFDGRLLLYEDGFSTADPLRNLIGENDDGSFGVGTSNLSLLADAGRTYVAVLQQFSTSAFGRGVVAGYAQEGTFTFGGAVANEADPAAGALAFAPASPNPAATAARVTLAVPTAGGVRLSVHDALGREVAVLADGPLAAGTHGFDLDASALAPGLYVVRATTASGAATQRLTVAR